MIDEIKQWILRRMSPNTSRCFRCLTTWNFVEHHITYYKNGNGCFALCEECWSELTPTKRLPYYEQLRREWERHRVVDEAEWDQIRSAVLDGK